MKQFLIMGFLMFVLTSAYAENNDEFDIAGGTVQIEEKK